MAACQISIKLSVMARLVVPTLPKVELAPWRDGAMCRCSARARHGRARTDRDARRGRNLSRHIGATLPRSPMEELAGGPATCLSALVNPIGVALRPRRTKSKRYLSAIVFGVLRSKRQTSSSARVRAGSRSHPRLTADRPENIWVTIRVRSRSPTRMDCAGRRCSRRSPGYEPVFTFTKR